MGILSFLSVVAMVSYAGLPQYFVDLLEDHCPFVRDPLYMHPDGCHYRDKHFYEMYCGAGNLWQAVCLDRCFENDSLQQLAADVVDDTCHVCMHVFLEDLA